MFTMLTDHSNPMLRLQDGDNVCSGTLVVEDGDMWNITCNENTKITADMMCKKLRCGVNVTHNFTCDRSQSVPPTLNCSGNMDIHTSHSFSTRLEKGVNSTEREWVNWDNFIKLFFHF